MAELANGVLNLTLNRPEKRNALNSATVGALHDAFDRAATDMDVSVVALRGAGKDFCAGADLAELLESQPVILPSADTGSSNGSVFRTRSLSRAIRPSTSGSAASTGSSAQR